MTLRKRHVQSSRHRSELEAADPPAGYGARGHPANPGTGSRGLDCSAGYDDQGKRVTPRHICTVTASHAAGGSRFSSDGCTPMCLN